MNSKVCSRCRTSKSLVEFYVSSSSKDGRQSVCSFCQKQYITALHKSDASYRKRQSDRRKSPDVIRQNSVRHRKQVHELRINKLDYLRDKKCVDCVEHDPVVLDFDHVRGVKSYSICTMVQAGFPWSSILVEIKKCDIRCASCHSSRTFKTLGWGAKPNDKHNWVTSYKKLKGCVDCKETDPIRLDLDHITQKVANVSVMVSRSKYTIDDVINEVKKCLVRCKNCHRRRTNERKHA